MTLLRSLLAFTDRLFAPLTAQADLLIPLFARFTFAAVLFLYYFKAGLSKFGEGLFGFLSPGAGAYAQIFPVKAEEVLYDPSQFALHEKLVVLAGTWAEIILPVLLVLGLFTRASALGMIGVVVVQSLTDIYGHMVSSKTIGALFDARSDGLIADQRLLWVFLLVVLMIKGGGKLSLDHLLRRSE